MKIKSVKTKLNGVGSCINDSEIEWKETGRQFFYFLLLFILNFYDYYFDPLLPVWLYAKKPFYNEHYPSIL